MKIGILSDTHNNIELTEKAISIFEQQSVSLIIHAGDLTSPKMLDLFKGKNCKFVLGNGDIDEEEINARSESLGFGAVKKTNEFTEAGKRFIVFHGNDVPLFRSSVASGKYDYIIKGHTHHFEDYISNNARVINPGSLYGSDEYSVVILDCEIDKVIFIKIDQG